jgi:hypothetical protein
VQSQRDPGSPNTIGETRFLLFAESKEVLRPLAHRAVSRFSYLWFKSLGSTLCSRPNIPAMIQKLWLTHHLFPLEKIADQPCNEGALFMTLLATVFIELRIFIFV